jgi:hypothetical protein
MKMDARHYQQWILTIEPGEGETWEDVTTEPTPSRREPVTFKPTAITLSVRSGDVRLMPRIHGLRYRADGSVGKLRHGTIRLPDWAAKLLAEARRDKGWSDAYFRGQGIELERE